MSKSARLLVITSCTGVKASLRAGQTLAAERLYAGEQHQRLMRGVEAFRSSRAARAGFSLDLWILSARYGLVPGARRLASYDTTFAGMPRAELDARAESLDVAADMNRLLSEPAALALVLLGDDYLRAAQLQRSESLAGPVLVLCGRIAAKRLGSLQGVRTVVVDNDAARRFSCGQVGLKGEIAARLLERVGQAPGSIDDLARPDFDLLARLASSTSQLSLSAAA